jgi:putative membrane protein
LAQSGDTKIEGLSRYLFIAPSWQRSLLFIFIMAFAIDAVSYFKSHEIQLFGFFGYFLPALAAFVLTIPLVAISGKRITPNRSALLALAGTVFSILISLFPILLIFEGIFPLLYSVSLGVIFGVRMIVLVAIADYRISRMLLPASTQSLVAMAAGTYYFGTDFLILTIFIHVLFGISVFLFLWLIERPLKKNFHISALNFINAFIAHNTDGSKALEDFFHDIGEEVFVPQTSFFFSREGKKDVLVTIPNLHPGPMGEIGGGNLPKILCYSFDEETLVPHGCATHDFNLVSEDEIKKIVTAVNKSRAEISYSPYAGKSLRYEYKSVKVLAQSFGDSILLVTTRSPEMTEDLDYSIGLSIMSEGHRLFPHVGFIDGHNCMVDVASPIMPASKLAYEYISASNIAIEETKKLDSMHEFEIGYCHYEVPFSREEGFGDLGIQVLAVRVEDQTTAYILFDGNNIEQGVREEIRNKILDIVDECELMTTDTHVVNTMSGKNPVGYRIGVEDMLPHVVPAVEKALEDLSPAQAGATTAWCEGVVVFGSQRISQLASTVNAMLTFIAPLGAAILVLAFLFSIIAYLFLV